MIVGRNLLNVAMASIGFQELTLCKYLCRNQNARGEFITVYKRPVKIKGLLQPVSADRLKDTGLDMTKRYWKLFTSEPLADIKRGASGDVIKYKTQVFNIVDKTDWVDTNGWSMVLLVEVG